LLSNANEELETMNSIDSKNLLRAWEELPFVKVMNGIRACTLAADATLHPGGAMLVCLDYPANYQAPAHWHTVGHAEIVLQGTLYVGEMVETAGSIRIVAPEIKYGPIRTAGEGCRVVEIFPVATLAAAAGREGEPGAGWIEPDVVEAGTRLGLS
jgi:hypothetical protein